MEESAIRESTRNSRYDIPKYAYGNEQELIVASVDFDKRTFCGYYKDIKGSFYFCIDKDIDDYEFYDDDTLENETYICKNGTFLKVIKEEK